MVAAWARINAEEHPDRLNSQNELARACQADGQIKENVELMEHVVAVKSIVFRKDHSLQTVSESVLNHLHAELLVHLTFLSLKEMRVGETLESYKAIPSP